jgi:predicted nucleic acid-binding Zn ribbon protein
MADEPMKVCPECQGKLTKILYPTGVIFKGSGFYTTDYKGSGKEPASSNGTSSGGSESKPSSDTKPETKGDSKGDSKTESKPDSSD